MKSDNKRGFWGVILGVALLVPVSTFAQVTKGAGHWQGLGAVFNQQGSQTGAFALDVVSEAVGQNELKSTITVVTAGNKQTYQQVLKDSGKNSFSIESQQGNGGGYCFGKGLCEAYLGTAEHGYAITIVIDGSDSRRMLVTELQNGQAIKFVRESLERVP